MATFAERPGSTLLELLFVLLILAILLGMAVPPLRALADRIAVVAARDAFAVGIARARAVAIARGGAVLVVDPDPGRFWIEGAAGDTVVAPVNVGAGRGVRVDAGGGAAVVRLSFDGLGIGRLTNRTLRVVRGRAEAGLTVSSYGRVRAW